MKWEYTEKTEKQLKNWFSNKKSSKPEDIEFKNFKDFKIWYDKQNKKCFYCDLSEEESQEIVFKGLLKSNRFPFNGNITRGVNRGYWLEIDRKNPKGKYSHSNCELSCYFCNNDKSDVFQSSQYGEFIKDRLGFLKSLLEENKKNVDKKKISS